MATHSPHPSFWLANLERTQLPSAEDLPESVDVVVIGGGLTGVSTAYWLSSLGIEALLLEKGKLSSGATGRNGGHIVADSDTDFAVAIQQQGLAEAKAILSFSRENFRQLHEFVEAHQVECDFRTNDLVSLALNAEQAAYLKQSCELMAAHGLISDFWDTQEVTVRTQSDAFCAGLRMSGHGQLWPAKLVIALAQQAIQQGAKLATHTLVKHVERHAVHITVRTDRGDVQTKAVVYATNALAYHLLPELKDIIKPVRGQALATAPAPRLWDFDWLANDGYEYAIQRVDGRIIFGGMRWRSPSKEEYIEDDVSIDHRVSQGLQAFLSDKFEPLRDIKIEYEWTGIMGFTPDEQPLIGELPHRPGEYIAAGFTGNGMSLGFLAGKVLAELIAGREGAPIPAAFAPRRFSGTDVSWLKHN